ncbi:hypothetical protein BT96DRAFT_1002577 [Gymnopus androsaceus JB14]|uniref:Uncharacterized protein n=1 Tax=Gymnopus androsaceus JB14 TaxID=1447944 RepID=A0A6A4GYC3_9AGAR|nr:hypothetical protein BT96DRAFT_1002577 [Gymnopus androsaceus JB14]
MISSQAQAAAIPQVILRKCNAEARDATAVTKRSPNVNVDSEALNVEGACGHDEYSAQSSKPSTSFPAAGDDAISLENLFSSSKPDWKLFSALSVASKTLRALTFEAWFKVLLIKSPEDLLDENLPFPEIKTLWTREIHLIHTESWDNFSSWNIEGFSRLNKVRIDCLSTGPLPGRFPFTGSTSLSSITEADVRGVFWPSPMVAQNISRTFPGLKVLKLQQWRIWCGLCHTCCIPKFQRPGPKTIRYEGDGIGLPGHYLQAFSSLADLEAVYLTVGMQDSGKTVLGSEEGKNQNLWSGECDRCIEVMYEDETFRREWVLKKKNVSVKPPRLTTVEWSFWLWPKQDDDTSDWGWDEEEAEVDEGEISEEEVDAGNEL